MAKIKRPEVTVKCPADKGACKGERIVEVLFPDGTTCLVSFSDLGGKNTIEVYRSDSPIVVLNNTNKMNV